MPRPRSPARCREARSTSPRPVAGSVEEGDGIAIVPQFPHNTGSKAREPDGVSQADAIAGRAPTSEVVVDDKPVLPADRNMPCQPGAQIGRIPLTGGYQAGSLQS